MRYWQKLWRNITRPSQALSDTDERQQATLVSGILFVFTVLLLGATLIFELFSRTMTLPFILMNIGLLAVYSGLYGLSRSRYYRWAARLFIWLGALGALYPYLFMTISIPERPLAFLSLVLIIAGISLSLWETIFTFVSIEILVIVAIAWHSDNDGTIFYIPSLLAYVGILTILFVSVNNAYRRRALEGEARYRELMKANSEGIMIIAEDDARILDANPAIEKILGYSPQEIIGRYPIEFIDKESKSLIWTAWGKRDKGIPIESLALHKDGSMVYVEAILKPYNYLNKSAYVLTLLDVSERKQVEALVIESEKRFRAIFNETSHFIGVLDVKGKIIEINEQGYEFFGLNASQTVGRYLWEIPQWAHSESSKQAIKEVLAAVQGGATMRYDVEVRNRDNLAAYLDFTLKPVHDTDGTVTMLIADSRDITAYKIAEQKRIEYERRYDALFKNTADAVLIVSLDGKFITVNDCTLTMLGCTLEEIQGVEISKYILAQEFSETLDNMERLKAGEEFSHVYERQLRRKNGEIFTAEITKMLVRDADNKPMYIQTMAREVTERKRMERQKLEIALEKERSKLLQHFIEQASHHFRTPITNLKTSIYLLPKFLHHEEKRREHIAVVNQELLRLQTLLDDLLTVLRLQKTDTEFSISKIEIGQLLGELRSSQEGREYYQKFSWEWDLLEENALVIGDKGVLARAFLNLLENAATYTQAGGKITVRAYQRTGWIAIEVIDTGMGIHENDLPHIFKDFYRTQDAMSVKATSSGLGLTISKSIIERHQGKIQVESRLGEGSRFQVLLPLYTEWTSTPPPLPAGEW